MGQKIEEAKNYFSHESMFYLFVLRFMDGRQRNEMLELRRIHYADREKAREWRDNIKNRLQPADQFVGTSIVYEAEQKLEELYRTVTYE